MATIKQVLEDLGTIKSNAAAYIAARDAIDVELKAQLANALANSGIPADVQADIDTAFAVAEEDKGQLAPPVPVALVAAPVVTA